MILAELGVKRPILTSVVFLIILIIGIISLANLGMDFLPDISFPALTIITQYEGTGPQEMETTVTKTIEGSVSTVPNIKNVFSTSAEGVSTIMLEFDWGTDLDEAANDVRDKLDLVRAFLPDDVQKPVLVKFSTSMIPVLSLAIESGKSYPKLYQIVDKKIIDELKQVDGVGDAFIMGGLIREIRVDLVQSRLNTFNLTIDQILGAIRANNVFTPGGNIKVGQSEFIIRIPAEYSSIEELKNVVIGNSKGIPVYLKDVADVKDTFKEENMIVRINGENGVVLMVQKQSKANSVQVVDGIFKRLKKIEKNLPDDVKLSVNFDTAQIIKDSIRNLNNSILLGGIFVILTILLLLIDWKASLIISLTIPFSLVVAFIFLYFFGYTINIMSLSSLAIAIGMVVDNAIVVTENIYRLRFEEKKDIQESSIKGASQVSAPVLASTLTTIVIFFPVLFISGIVAILFKQLALSIIIVLIASLFVSLFLTPSLASLLFKQKPKHPLFLKAAKINEGIIEKIKCKYRTFLAKALIHRKRTVFIMGAIFFSSLLLLGFIGKEFMPQADQSIIRGSIELESNITLENADAVMRRIDDLIQKEIPERVLFNTRVGRSSSGIGGFMEQGNNLIQIIVRLKPRLSRKRSAQDLSLLLTKEIRQIPGVKEISLATTGGPSMFGGDKPVSIEIYGYDLDKTLNFARRIRGIMESVKGVNNVTISRKSGKAEIKINIDKLKAQNLGLSSSQIANTIKNSFAGVVASRYQEEGDEYDIFLRLRQDDRNALENVKNTLIRTSTGRFVSVENLANITIKPGPKNITRKNKERYLTVDCEIYGRSLSDVVNDIQNGLNKIAIPNGLRYEFAGSAKEQREAFGLLFQAFLLGVLLVYLIMAAQFESFIDPFIIMFSVPFAVTGVFYTLFLTGVTLNVNSFVGIIMLVGIVVNNAIILITVINDLRRHEGYKLTEAILTGCSIRLRPILMTTITTMLGVLPMALSRGEGAEQWVPLGVSLFGGLLVSTLITLILIPTIYFIFERRKAAMKNQLGQISMG